MGDPATVLIRCRELYQQLEASTVLLFYADGLPIRLFLCVCARVLRCTLELKRGDKEPVEDMYV